MFLIFKQTLASENFFTQKFLTQKFLDTKILGFYGAKIFHAHYFVNIFANQFHLCNSCGVCRYPYMQNTVTVVQHEPRNIHTLMISNFTNLEVHELILDGCECKTGAYRGYMV